MSVTAERNDGSTSTTEQPRVSVRHLSKSYQTKRGRLAALQDVSVEVAEGEILVLLGPSGCGKTTLLRSVAGLEQPDSGEIRVHGETVYSSEQGISLAPERRRLSMVFQSYALWPHLTVARNIAYPLRTAKLPKDEVEARVEHVLETVGLTRFAGNYPGQLSGGQQQRVALARALVANQGVILFDEPLSNLDAKVRERLREELLALHERLGFTALYVTHDQTEATGLADRIAVMEVGEVAQLGEPMEVYMAPRTRYVADFVGSGNRVPGTVIGAAGELDGAVAVETSLGELVCTPVEADLTPGVEVEVMFRPEHLRVVAHTDGVNSLKAEVAQSVFLGSHLEHIVMAGSQRLVVHTMEGGLLERGAAVCVRLDPLRARAFPVSRA
ncbi:MAG: ABC transporter ATP-binding protein [Nocardioides sp.]|uniref:ABC transporter ATP-binding protein n=1 Tax=Nocardioides sp. TaxID=35761 RepID=UPI0039E4596C